MSQQKEQSLDEDCDETQNLYTEARAQPLLSHQGEVAMLTLQGLGSVSDLSQRQMPEMLGAVASS